MDGSIDRLEMKWIGGAPMDFWVRHHAEVERYIKENKLAPFTARIREIPRALYMVPPAPTAEAAGRFDWPNGGMRIAHLHWKGEIYMLTDKQWRDFSAGILKDFRARLAVVKTINFMDALQFEDVLTSLK